MNLIKKTSLVFSLLAAASSSIAQSTATTGTHGLLGQRYLEFNYTLADLDAVSNHGHTTAIAANLPLVPSTLDVGATYAYSWFRGAVRGHSNTVAAYANAFIPTAGAKPFLGAAIGYSWVTLPFGLSDDDPSWNVTAGVEVPLGAVTLTPRLTYADDFNGRVGNTDDSWTYEVEGHYWFAPRMGAFASIAFTDYHRDPIDVWGYRVGLRLRF